MELSKKHTCCFVGDWKTELTDELLKKLNDMIETLIEEEKVDTFLFGGKSEAEYAYLCAVSKLKVKHPHIQRIRTSTGFPFISDFVIYDDLDGFDDTYYPGRILPDGKTVYYGRENESVEMSDFCIVYDEEKEDFYIK